MKPVAFDYLLARSVDEAVSHLVGHGSDAMVLAGGQSLMPMLAFRLAEPAVLVDINRIAGLDRIELQGDMLHLGALCRYAQLERDPLVQQYLPLLTQALPHIAHAAIRQRGTLGGSLSLSDPAAEMPACMVALDARMVIQGQAGQRIVAAEAFFQGLYQTALRQGELLVRVEVPVGRIPGRIAFAEFSRRHGDYAMAGLAAWRGTSAPAARLVFFGCADRPARAGHAESLLLAHEAAPAFDMIRQALEADLTPEGDLQANAQTKRHLAAVLLQRAWPSLQSASGGTHP
ncbi:MAG: xanthine dehydrogenase family protein subunit [Polaromonas sp.]|nr:xanthine dehydrogenase family protein subunit [Polaromonas sp.]